MKRLGIGFILLFNLLVLAGYLYFSHLNGTSVLSQADGMAFAMFPVVGAVLLARHPRNPVGSLVTLVGLAVLGASMLFEYASLALNPQTAGYPLTGLAAWLSMILWPTVLPNLVMILLLFPDGRLPGRRWRLLAMFVAVVAVPFVVITAVIAWPYRHLIASMDTGRLPFPDIMVTLFRAYDVWALAMIASIILALISFLFRFQQTRGIQRQQLKWFVFGLSTIPVALVMGEIVSGMDAPILWTFADLVNLVSIALFPVVMLIAITRYRLYDIDFLIRRTLLYTILTITLALAYFGSVVALQMLFTLPLGDPSEGVIVVSTLLIATLFQPLRRGMQTWIDRRFYRKKYDAQQTLERFATSLHSEVNLEQIEDRFLTTVEGIIQPESIHFWRVNVPASPSRPGLAGPLNRRNETHH